jgi:ketosteroid isomerase-like protein
MDAAEVVREFNGTINAQDPDGLAKLMSDDHEFIDSEGIVLSGKERCLEAWRGFFQQFADYRNTFVELITRDDCVVVVGFSTCSFDQLDGPALWTARIRDDTVTQWRVYLDTPETRRELDLGGRP